MTHHDAAIGIDIGGTGTKGAIVARDGAVLERVDHPTEPQAGTKSILAAVQELVGRAADFGVELSCIGVGAAGFIDAASGSVTFAPNLVYDDPHIAAALKATADLPVVVDNDANAAAWGERAFGAARGSDHVVLLTLGTGIGTGFIVDGRLIRGFTGAGAEMGHTIVDPDGPACGCGLNGCLEQFTSGQAIARMAREALAGGEASSLAEVAPSLAEITSHQVSRAAAGGDEVASAVLRRAGTMLGVGLSNVANIFDPEVLVLSGSVAGAGEGYLGPARDELVRMTAAQRRRPLHIAISSLGRDAGIIGAAALAFDEAS